MCKLCSQISVMLHNGCPSRLCCTTAVHVGFGYLFTKITKPIQTIWHVVYCTRNFSIFDYFGRLTSLQDCHITMVMWHKSKKDWWELLADISVQGGFNLMQCFSNSGSCPTRGSQSGGWVARYLRWAHIASIVNSDDMCQGTSRGRNSRLSHFLQGILKIIIYYSKH